MSFTYSFFDDQTVGAYELNNITRLFVSKGIEDPFEDGMPYSITKLNDIVYSKGSPGVVPESNNTLKVTVSGKTVTINTGTAFFEDGTVITITKPHQLELVGEGKHYIYLKSSVEENMAYPVISTIEPVGNFVLLAEITEDGEIIDKRAFAKGRIPSVYASDAGIAMKATGVITEPDQEIVLSEGPHTYNYYLLRFSGAGENSLLWQTFVFINTEKPEQSFYMGNYNDTVFRGSRGATLDNFTAVSFDFGGDGISETVLGRLTTDDGIKLQVTCPDYEKYTSTFDFYVFPFAVELYAF